MNYFFSFLLFALCSQITFAEKADNQKPLHIKAETQNYDGNKKVIVYSGAVHMEKGTLVIDAERLEITKDASDKKIGTLFGSPTNLVKYRQKRDGGADLWAEGEAEKVIYDENSGTIKLFNYAKLILLDGKKRTHESAGKFISYNTFSDFMSVNNTIQGISMPGAGFTNAVIYPTDNKSITKSKTTPITKNNTKPSSRLNSNPNTSDANTFTNTNHAKSEP